MEGFDSWVLFSTVLIPFAAVAIILLIPGERQRELKSVSVAAAVLALAASVYVFFAYDYSTGGLQLTGQFEWLNALGVSYHQGVDGLAVPMILLTGVVFLTGALISTNITRSPKEYFVLLLLLVAGVFGVFVSLDLFFFFFFFELAVLPMYMLIGIWGSSSDFGTFLRPKEYGAMKLVLYLVAGSVLVWIALIAVYIESPVKTFDLLLLKEVAFSREFQLIFFPLFMLGFGVLAGIWPFHTWSPDGHVAAPTAVSMLHAGVLMKLGAFGIIRVGLELFPEGAQAWMPVLIGLGTVNVLYGAISALGQSDLKYVVGYSSVSHMGYVLMGIATLEPLGVSGAVLQMFSHGIMTALFFALVGAIYDRTHIRDITILEGLGKKMGLTAAFFGIAGLTSLGLPGLSGFVAELLVFIGLFRTYPVLAILGIIGAAITAIYILRLLGKVFFGPISKEWDHLPDLSKTEGVATAILVLFLVGIGLYPLPIMQMIDSGVATLLVRVLG
jgi:NADH-quinone oxidoreductase subunit M